MKKTYFFNKKFKNYKQKIKIFLPLHIINNLRFNYIKSQSKIEKKTILDVGCGVGLLTKKLAAHGANIIGIDKSKEFIKIAKSYNHNEKINYLNCSLASFCKKYEEKFDLIICTELIEHIKNKNNIISLLKKLSHKNSIIILSSLNRNILTYINTILFGEYITKILDKNTHYYKNFINLNEIYSYFQKKNLKIKDIKNLSYNPMLNYSSLKDKNNINYIITIINAKHD